MVQEKTKEGTRQTITPDQLTRIQELANGIQYGSIELVFQNGLLVQIARSEKIRITKQEN